MKPKPLFLALLCAAGLAVALGGCAREFPNAPLAAFDPDRGYRIDRVAFDEGEDLALIVTFSGGGTRAAAFALGALEALADATYESDGEPKSVLDEVDIISSVSGGSVTAAAYGLYGRDAFKRLQEDFLYEDIIGELVLKGLNPVTWFRLMSPNYSRIDALVEIFDARLFDGATYARLETRGLKPYIVLNAADMSSGDVFSMTQEDFDLICSDLSKLTLAHATAASAAFPVALTPITLKNYSAGGCAVDFPDDRWQWIADAVDSKQIDLDLFRWAKRDLALRFAKGAEQSPQYIHLLDGGLADNLGLHTPMRLLGTLHQGGSLLDDLNDGLIKRVAIIVVNARSDADRDLDNDPDTPSLFDMISAVASVPIDRVISGRQQGIRALIDGKFAEQQGFLGCENTLKDACDATMPFPIGFSHTNFYTIDIDFDLVEDKEKRRKLKNIPTTWSLNRDQVNLLRDAAKELFDSSAQFQELLADLRANN